jgi:hypothetical protein
MEKKVLITAILVLAIILVLIVGYFRLTGFAVVNSGTSVTRKIRQISDNPLRINISLDVKSSDFALGISEKIPNGLSIISADNNSVNFSDRIEWLFVPGKNVQLSYVLQSSVNATNFSGTWFSTESEGNITGNSYFIYQKSEIPKKQWASSVTAPSFYNANWKPEFAVGASDSSCSYFKPLTGWSKMAQGATDAITLSYSKPVYATGIEVYHFGYRAIDYGADKVELQKPDGSWDIVWQGTSSACQFNVSFDRKAYLTSKIRITTKSGYWANIDAVKLIGS